MKLGVKCNVEKVTNTILTRVGTSWLYRQFDYSVILLSVGTIIDNTMEWPFICRVRDEVSTCGGSRARSERWALARAQRPAMLAVATDAITRSTIIAGSAHAHVRSGCDWSSINILRAVITKPNSKSTFFTRSINFFNIIYLKGIVLI